MSRSLGSGDIVSKFSSTDNFAAQIMITTRRPRFRAKADEEGQYYPFQYRLNVRIPLHERLLANGW